MVLAAKIIRYTNYIIWFKNVKFCTFLKSSIKMCLKLAIELNRNGMLDLPPDDKLIGDWWQIWSGSNNDSVKIPSSCYWRRLWIERRERCE